MADPTPTTADLLKDIEAATAPQLPDAPPAPTEDPTAKRISELEKLLIEAKTRHEDDLLKITEHDRKIRENQQELEKWHEIADTPEKAKTAMTKALARLKG